MEIYAKYPGRCKKCGQNIAVGEKIDWKKGEGASHLECPAAPAAPKIEPPQAPKMEEIYSVPENLRETVIECSYHDGEYLSGYSVYDPTNTLEKLGLCRYIDGWGSKIDDSTIKALGEKFTLGQAEVYAKPSLEQKAREKYEKALKKYTETTGAFEEAKRTGKPVIIAEWSDECNDPDEECDIDNITKYAMPDGSTKIERSHTW
jgi:hypothetical protein